MTILWNFFFFFHRDWNANHHLQPAVQAAKDFTLKAVYSRSLSSAQNLASKTSGVDLYSEDAGPGKGYADLLARDDISAVIIAYVYTIILNFFQALN